MQRKILCVGVWKDQLTFNQSVAAARHIAELTNASAYPFECGIAPSPFAYVATRDIISQHGFETVAQNIMWHEDSGSYIGETTAPMLKEQGCKYVIVGHSERRLMFAETDEIVARKFKTCLDADLFPIICIGDTSEDRAANLSWDKLERQISAFLDGTHKLSPHKFAIAYEPVWAISTWRNKEPLPSGSTVEAIQAQLRSLVAQKTNADFAQTVSILYGGSVNSENGREYLLQPNVDGALIGGASKSPTSYVATLDACKEGLLCRSEFPRSS